MLKYVCLIGMLCISVCLLGQTTISYQTSSLDFPNPERGFYRYSETRSSNYTFLNQSTLEGYRNLHTPPTASYSIYSTLVFRYFFLEDFKTSNISQAYLDNMQTDFNTARMAGVKLIPRFAYTDEVNPNGCDSWICPPYGDAAKSWVLTHIGQLKPVLEANKDVIATVQMGFIGVWGENYYTDYFGDASQAPNYKLDDNNWTDRIEVLNALLDAVPMERMVQARYPQKKQRTVYGINATTSSSPLTVGEAFSGTDKARIGLHNDCLLASPDDYGTHTDYGNSSTPSTSDTANLKPYFAADSKFVVVGGETCDDAYSPYNDCASSHADAYGDTELERMHYSYLNSQYNNDVNNDWHSAGCMEEIKKRLGYRFELQHATFSDAAQPNQVINIDINLKNVGYASPYNARGFELILRNTMTSDIWIVTLPDDPRFWFADNTTHNISKTICVPAEVPLGDYEMFLFLPDPMPSLYASPDYAIRLANLLPDNSDPWEPSTGYNRLGHTISINNTAANASCGGEITFAEVSALLLPVDLLGFEAIAGTKEIKLEWVTATERNNDGFFIERSLDARNFSRIGWVNGKGTTDETTNYSYTDASVDGNVTYYYRLAQKDFDGHINYAQVVSAKAMGNTSDFARSIKIYPNPARDMVSITWDNTLDDIVEIKLLDAIGQEWSIQKGREDRIDLSNLPDGMYIVKLKTRNKEYVKKLIK